MPAKRTRGKRDDSTASTIRFVDPRPLAALVTRWRREAHSVQGWGATLRRCARELSRVLRGRKETER